MIAAVVSHECDVTNDVMWHVPQGHMLSPTMNCSISQQCIRHFDLCSRDGRYNWVCPSNINYARHGQRGFSLKLRTFLKACDIMYMHTKVLKTT